MPISFVCPDCARKLKVPDTAGGEKIRCPSCKAVVRVPEPEFVGPEPEEEVAKAPATKNAPRSAKPRKDDDYAFDDEDEEVERRREKKRKTKKRDREESDRMRRSYQPHRGGTVLTYGILSLVAICFPLGSWYFAWQAINMAGEDLPKMASRRMDPAGKGMTQTGNILGMIGAGVSLIVLIVGLALSLMGLLKK